MATKPKKLEEGDCVGIVAPCSPIGKANSKRFRNCLKILKELGLKYKIGKYVHENNDYMSGTPIQRAEDINNFFRDKKIKAVWCTNGGISGQLALDYLDYELIKKNPKVFIGYSDVNNYNMALFSKANLLNFYGPNLSNYGDSTIETKEYSHSTLKFLRRILFEKDFRFEIEYAKKHFRNNKHKKKVGTKVITQGRSEGILIGGCAPLFFNVLLGTKYCKIPKRSILFLELGLDDPPIVEGYLWRLEQLNYFQNIRGILLGKGDYKSKDCKTSTYEIFKKYGEKYNIPILVNLDIGHTEPMLTMPIGAEVEINTKKETFIIKEPVVK